MFSPTIFNQRVACPVTIACPVTSQQMEENKSLEKVLQVCLGQEILKRKYALADF